jgi:nicotinamidase-related amidase
VTAVAGGVTVWSGLDTEKRYDSFAETRTDPGLRDAGRAAQTRTNVLLGVTATAAVATAALGLFVVDFRSEQAPERSVQVSPGWVRGTF